MAHRPFRSLMRGLLGQPRVAERAELRDLLAREASFVAQKCTVEYCRARSGLLWSKLFKEKAFATALEACRWDSFAAVLSDLSVIAEGKLRGPGVEGPALADRMADVAAEALASFGPPPHRPDWIAAQEGIRLRLAQAALAAPQPAHEIARVSAAIIFESLPIHPSVRAHDRELVTNNLRFALSRSASTLEERLDLELLRRDLLAPLAAGP